MRCEIQVRTRKPLTNGFVSCWKKDRWESGHEINAYPGGGINANRLEHTSDLDLSVITSIASTAGSANDSMTRTLKPTIPIMTNPTSTVTSKSIHIAAHAI
jgi:hypothetical protein